MNVNMDYDDYCKMMGSGLVALIVLGIIGWAFASWMIIWLSTNKKAKMTRT